MEKQVLEMLNQTLHLNGRGLTFNQETRLLGALPEIDSLAIASLLAAIESRFKIQLEDDEIDGSIFETVGSLGRFIQKKIDQGRT